MSLEIKKIRKITITAKGKKSKIKYYWQRYEVLFSHKVNLASFLTKSFRFYDNFWLQWPVLKNVGILEKKYLFWKVRFPVLKIMMPEGQQSAVLQVCWRRCLAGTRAELEPWGLIFSQDYYPWQLKLSWIFWSTPCLFLIIWNWELTARLIHCSRVRTTVEFTLRCMYTKV